MIGVALLHESSFASLSCLEQECPPPQKLTRSTSHGAILLNSADDSACSSDSSPLAEKRLTWLDTTSGHHLTYALPFYKDDETWRCNKHGHGPLLTRVGSPTAEPLLNASLPTSTSELMRKVLGGAGVALEDVHIAGDCTYLFVSLVEFLSAFSHFLMFLLL